MSKRPGGRFGSRFGSQRDKKRLHTDTPSATTVESNVPKVSDVAVSNLVMGKMESLLFVSDAGAGHMLPMLRLAMAMRQRGHRVIVSSFEEWRTRVQADGFAFISAGSYKTRWTPIPRSQWYVRRIEEELQRKRWQPFGPALTKQMQADPPSLLVCDFLGFDCKQVAAHAGIPYVIVAPALGNVVDRKIPAPGASALALRVIRNVCWFLKGGAPLRALRQAPSGLFQKGGSVELIDPAQVGLSSTAFFRGDMRALLLLSSQALEYPHHVPLHAFLGAAQTPSPTFPTVEPQLQRWWRSDRSVVYMSFGTELLLDQTSLDVLVLAARKLEGRGVRLLWSLPQQQRLQLRHAINQMTQDNLKVGEWAYTCIAMIDATVVAHPPA